MPTVRGAGAAIHVSEVDTIVENDVPLLELPVRAASREDEVIGRTIADMVPDGACLQMGVGALPNLVCRGRSIYTFAMGQKRMYDFLDGNPGVESRPVDYVNDPRVITRNDRVISVNATLQVDLTGACNAEHLLGQQYSESGGQLDFVRGAYASREGKSIIACHATASKSKVSRIVPRLDGPVTTPRIDTQIVVTEHGWTDLKGRSSTERANALIELAQPELREGLRQAAREMHLI